MEREEALALLKQYNKEPFHIQHALTVEAVMGWFAEKLGYGDEKEFWRTVGLLHDLDFEMYPEQHCVKEVEIMTELGLDPRLIHAVASHGYGICIDVKPEHEMEKVLFASDELTGLIGAAIKMRPSRSTKVCRRLFPAGDPRRRGNAGLGTGQAHGGHHPGHAGI